MANKSISESVNTMVGTLAVISMFTLMCLTLAAVWGFLGYLLFLRITITITLIIIPTVFILIIGGKELEKKEKQKKYNGL